MFNPFYGSKYDWSKNFTNILEGYQPTTEAYFQSDKYFGISWTLVNNKKLTNGLNTFVWEICPRIRKKKFARLAWSFWDTQCLIFIMSYDMNKMIQSKIRILLNQFQQRLCEVKQWRKLKPTRTSKLNWNNLLYLTWNGQRFSVIPQGSNWCHSSIEY